MPAQESAGAHAQIGLVGPGADGVRDRMRPRQHQLRCNDLPVEHRVTEARQPGGTQVIEEATERRRRQVQRSALSQMCLLVQAEQGLEIIVLAVGYAIALAALDQPAAGSDRSVPIAP